MIDQNELDPTLEAEVQAELDTLASTGAETLADAPREADELPDEETPEVPEPEAESDAPEAPDPVDDEIEHAKRLVSLIRSKPEMQDFLLTAAELGEQEGYDTLRARLTAPASSAEPQAPAPPAPEEDDDEGDPDVWVDPAVREARRDAREALEMARATQARYEAEQEAKRLAISEAALMSYAAAHPEYDVSAIQRILDTSKKYQLLATVVSTNADPLNYETWTPAIHEALDVAAAYALRDEMKARATQQTVQQLQQRSRQRIPGAASVSRQKPAPRNEPERLKAMEDEIAEAMNGGTA